MRIPDTGKKKALVIVDMQPAFIDENNSSVVSKVKGLIEKVEYDAYIEVVFSAEKGSVWDVQKNWSCPQDDTTHSVPDIRELLKAKEPLRVHKHTRSVFAGNPNAVQYLKDQDIEEVHIVGVETDDCVLATAYGAFDSGFLTYVLEECCAAATGGRHQTALDILRIQGMTNNRCLANTIELDV